MDSKQGAQYSKLFNLYYVKFQMNPKLWSGSDLGSANFQSI
jgi:hypothetical protein